MGRTSLNGKQAFRELFLSSRLPSSHPAEGIEWLRQRHSEPLGQQAPEWLSSRLPHVQIETLPRFDQRFHFVRQSTPQGPSFRQHIPKLVCNDRILPSPPQSPSRPTNHDRASRLWATPLTQLCERHPVRLRSANKAS